MKKRVDRNKVGEINPVSNSQKKGMSVSFNEAETAGGANIPDPDDVPGGTSEDILTAAMVAQTQSKLTKKTLKIKGRRVRM